MAHPLYYLYNLLSSANASHNLRLTPGQAIERMTQLLPNVSTAVLEDIVSGKGQPQPGKPTR